MCQNKYYVYALIDPINNLPFYIGKGSGNRAYQHFSKNEKCNLKKITYIKNIRNLGFEPRVEFIQENMLEDDAYFLESVCIKYGKQFLPLTNCVGLKKPPNRKGCKMSKEARIKISIALSNRIRQPMSDVQKKKLSIANTNKVLSIETREKISKALKEKSFRIEKSLLLELRKTKTIAEIADMFNVSIGPIKRLIKLHGIQTKIVHV